MLRHAAAFCLLALGCFAGCARMDLPPNFMALERANRGPYDYRAVSPDGMVLAVRTVGNPTEGKLGFWSESVKKELTGRGYECLSSEAVTNRSGTAGTLMTFAEGRDGQKLTYQVAVFVRWHDILVAEAGGESSLLAANAEPLRKALLSAR